MTTQQTQVASATYYFIKVPSFEKVLAGTFSPEDVSLSVVSERPEPLYSKEAQSVYLIKDEFATLSFLDSATRFDCLKAAVSLVEQHTPFDSIKKLIETNRDNKNTDWIKRALRKQFDEKDTRTVSRSL